MKSIAHLHVHSDFSLLSSLCKVKNIASVAQEKGVSGVALADQGNMFGTMEFFLSAKGKINSLAACEVFLQPLGYTAESNEYLGLPGPFPMVLIAKDRRAYQNLIKLVSIGYLQGFLDKPRIDMALLKQYSEGLIALSGSMQSLSKQLLLNNKDQDAYEHLETLNSLFPKDHFYIEILNHQIEGEKAVNEKLIQFARQKGIPLVAANETYYFNQDDKYAQEILFCIADKTRINFEKGEGRDKRRVLPGSGYHFKSFEEMQKDFSHIPDALENTLKIQGMCDLVLGEDEPHWPNYEIPAGKTSLGFLREQCVLRLQEKNIALDETYQQRLDYELSIIEQMGFGDYFLIVADFVNEAKNMGMLVGPGRGSAAGSLVSFAMGITGLDPVHYNLLFERFLNPERVSLPDVDIDFQDNRREEVIDYCKRKYGAEKVSQIVTYGKLKAKAVFKDVCRVFNIDFQEANKISALMGTPKNLKEAYSKSIAFKDTILSNPKLQEIYRHSLKLEGLTRQTGIHAAGVIIADKPIDDYAPLYMDQEQKLVVTQYEGTMLEEPCGLIKMDFLGLKTLSILDDAINLIKTHYHIDIDLDNLPLDDKGTYELLARGAAAGVFQFESDGMRNYLKKLKPTHLDDLIAMNAMYRPGPLAWIPVYIAKKHKQEPTFQSEEEEQNYKYLEKLVKENKVLEEILSPTNLIPIYQEQIMELGRGYAGFTLGGADNMRRVIGKKKIEKIPAIKKEFIEGAVARGSRHEDAEFLFEKVIGPFANYGFNKSHAACYAYIAYQTAYLKSNYPECFMAALLNSELDDTNKIKQYIEECRHLNIEIIPPSVNDCGIFFEVKDKKIIFSLSAIKGVGQSSARIIVAMREESGLFESFSDFLQALAKAGKHNKQLIEQLMYSGSFVCINDNTALLESIYPLIEDKITKEEQMTTGGQITLFGGAQEEVEEGDDFFIRKLSSEVLKPDENWFKEQEKKALGFNLRYDPVLNEVRNIRLLSNINPAHFENIMDQKDVQLAGMLQDIQIIQTSRDQKDMARLKLDTGVSQVPVTIWPKNLDRFRELAEIGEGPPIENETMVICKGRLKFEERWGSAFFPDIIDFYTTEKISDTAYDSLHIEFSPGPIREDQFLDLRDMLHESYGTQCSILLHFTDDAGLPKTIHAGSQLKINPENALRKRLTEAYFIQKYWFA